MNELFAQALERQRDEMLQSLRQEFMDWAEGYIQQSLLARYLTLAEAAKYLHVSEQTVRRMVTDKTLPCFRVRNQIMLRQIDVDGWIQRQIDEGR